MLEKKKFGYWIIFPHICLWLSYACLWFISLWEWSSSGHLVTVSCDSVSLWPFHWGKKILLVWLINCHKIGCEEHDWICWLTGNSHGQVSTLHLSFSRFILFLNLTDICLFLPLLCIFHHICSSSLFTCFLSHSRFQLYSLLFPICRLFFFLLSCLLFLSLVHSYLFLQLLLLFMLSSSLLCFLFRVCVLIHTIYPIISCNSLFEW